MAGVTLSGKNQKLTIVSFCYILMVVVCYSAVSFVRAIHKGLYATGLLVIRAGHRMHRRLVLIWNAVANFVDSLIDGFEAFVDKMRAGLDDETKARNARVKQHAGYKAHVAHAYYTNGIFSATAKWMRLTCASLRRNLFRVRRALNYLVPAAGVCALVLIVGYVANLNLALAVEIDGETIAYIEDESTYAKARDVMLERIIFSDSSEMADVQTEPNFSLTIVQNDSIADEYALCDTLLTMSGDKIVQGTGLYIDGVFVGATDRGRELGRTVEEVLAQYKIEEADRPVFIEDVQLRNGIYPAGSVKNYAEMRSMLLSQPDEMNTYTAESGDTIDSVAAALGVPVSTIYNLNPALDTQLEEGVQIRVTDQPLLQVAIQRTETREVTSSYKTVQQLDANENRGYTREIQAGEAGITLQTLDVTYLNGEKISEKVLSEEFVSAPVNRVVIVGTKMPNDLQISGSFADSVGTGSFMHPLNNAGYLSCRIWGYSGHKGTDYASKRGTPIYAADSGVVTTKIHNGGGYGHYLIIDHGYGVQTLYAHCSELFVDAGDIVAKGDVIAAVGATGNTTGPHVHWEVRINGSYVDGNALLGRSYR